MAEIRSAPERWYTLKDGDTAFLDHGQTRYTFRVEAEPLCTVCHKPEGQPGDHSLCDDESGFLPAWSRP